MRGNRRFSANRRRTSTAPTRTVDVFGRDWVLPAEMPAAFVLLAADLTDGRNPADELSYRDSLKLARALLPAGVLAAWLALDISEGQLWAGVIAVVIEYRGNSSQLQALIR